MKDVKKLLFKDEDEKTWRRTWKQSLMLRKFKIKGDGMGRSGQRGEGEMSELIKKDGDEGLQ